MKYIRVIPIENYTARREFRPAMNFVSHAGL